MVKRRDKPVSTNNDTDNTFKEHFKEPRHAYSIQCDYCGIKTGGGGYATTKKRDDLEKEARKEHDKFHKEMEKEGKGKTVTVEENGQFVQKIPPLKVSRSSHKVEAEHSFNQQATRQALTSTTYTTITNSNITSGSFDVGEKYLIVAMAQIDCGSSTAADQWIRAVHGSTAFADSEMITEIDTASHRHTYMYWVVWTAVSGEDFHLEHRSSSGVLEIGTDVVFVTALKLTPDLVEGTDWDDALDTDSTALTTSDSSSNNAAVTITPAAASHKWLILSKARYGISGSGIANTEIIESRIHRSGEATNDYPVCRQEGEDASNSVMVLCGLRTDTLGATSNTYTEISKLTATTTAPNRLSSGIFMLDLDKFKNVETLQEESETQDTPNTSTTVHSELVHTESLTTAQTGDVWTLAHVTMDSGGAGFGFHMRLQIDNTDQPAGQSTKDYIFKQWDSTDRIVWAMQTVGDNLTAGTYTADIDGSLVDTTGTEGSYTRNLTMFTFEYAAAAGVTSVKNETEAITENVVRVIGTAGKQVKNETEAITETVIPIVTSTLSLIQDENIVLRLSGGTSNTSTAASLGGARSTAGGGVISNKLFDDVTLAEAAAGDVEYRCFYILNAHGSLQASSVKIWIPQNTPGQDEIDIALGSSAVNGTEQTVANESTSPTSVTFVQANSEGTAINCGNLPAGQHRAIWLRRNVPVSAAFFPNNTYQLQVSLYSDHS
jgi:hypothetical protein